MKVNTKEVKAIEYSIEMSLDELYEIILKSIDIYNKARGGVTSRENKIQDYLLSLIEAEEVKQDETL